MNMPKFKILCLIGLMMLASQTAVFAGNRPPSHRGAPYTHWQKPPAHHSKGRQRAGNYRNVPAPYYQHYYKPGYRVNPLPYGHSRVFVNAAEYYFFDGFFYRPYGGGYVVVEAPLGAIIATLPRLHQSIHWHGQPYFLVGTTFYRRHPGGYIVVPNPGYGYRR